MIALNKNRSTATHIRTQSHIIFAGIRCTYSTRKHTHTTSRPYKHIYTDTDEHTGTTNVRFGDNEHWTFSKNFVGISMRLQFFFM